MTGHGPAADARANGQKDAPADARKDAQKEVRKEAQKDTQDDAATLAWFSMRTFVLRKADKRKQVTEALGMSYFRAKTLRTIVIEGPLTLSALAASLYTDAPFATVTVDHLVRRGLVVRTPHPDDRRAKLVRATDEGEKAAAEMIRLSDTPPESLAALPEDDLRTLARILGTLAPPE